MAAAVGSAPHLGGHAQQAAYNYQNGVSVLEDSEDGDHQYMEHQIAEEEMDHYYQHHYQGQMHPEQLQYHHYQPGDDEDPEEEEMYSDESSDESILPDENIDFSLIYALHTFLATVEGQASVVKGDSLLLLDDANSYWWLVRVLKTEDVGYIPAENVETPYERLARLNKHRNIDIAAPTREEAAIGEAPREKKLRSFIGWKSRTPDQADPPKEGRRVVFAPPTYVEHPGITWDEEEVEEETQQQTVPLQEHEYAEDDIDQDLDDDGYDAEPDDGVEWAQDAVEVVRSGAGAGAGAGANLQAVPESSLDHTVESRETAIVTPENAQLSGGASSIASTDKAAAAAAAAAAVAAGGVAAAGVTHPPAPARLPSPSAPTGALARTNPTPPPHRAGLTSPENSMRGISVTPPPPPSSDAHAYVAAQATARSPPITPKSAARLSVLDTQPAGAGAGAGAASAAVAGAAAAGAVAMASSAPSTSSKTRYPPKTRVMQYHADVFEITRLATLVRARSDEDRRTRRPARAPDADAVQAKLYGERIALDVLHPDVRAGYVHLQARMDAFDREVDSLLGALVAIR